jgi:hypothetical protein
MPLIWIFLLQDRSYQLVEHDSTRINAAALRSFGIDGASVRQLQISVSFVVGAG